MEVPVISGGFRPLNAAAFIAMEWSRVSIAATTQPGGSLKIPAQILQTLRGAQDEAWAAAARRTMLHWHAANVDPDRPYLTQEPYC